MRIVHLCLSCFYIDGRSYQENELVRQNVADGHTVLVIASTESHSHDGKLCYLEPTQYAGSDGAEVIRLPYSRFLPKRIAPKLRVNEGVFKALTEFQPDVILFHGTCGWELLTVKRYVSHNPSVRFFVDSHEDPYNSARSVVSRELLHKIYYKFVLRRALPSISKILCVSTEAMDFVESMYEIPRDRLEFFPLGGRPVPAAEYEERRRRTRCSLDLFNTDILIIQSGKQTKRKKLLESLSAFHGTSAKRLHFMIAGVLDEEIRSEAEALIRSDPRIKFLGWKNSNELTDLLCAADIYLQPGTQSATMQHSICCRCAIAIDDTPAHRIYHKSNGWLLNDSLTLEELFRQVLEADLADMQKRSESIALSMLDYAKLAKRFTTS